MTMKHILKKILDDAKNVYKEIILMDSNQTYINKNNNIEDKLLSIITNVTFLLNELNSKSQKETVNNDIDEVIKVKRRVPKWIKNPNQYNAKILNTFMKLSNNNQFSVAVSTLQKHSSLESNIFYKNYNQMKNIGERNHGKVFEEENGNVRLWEPVAGYIVNLYERDSKNE